MTSPSVKLLRTQTDERLVALAAAGHERAFEAIVERYRRPLLRHCRRYLPEARAEDALQQALVSAWSALRRGDDVRELRPWLHRIVHNTSLNALRANGYDYEHLRDTLRGQGGPAELAERSAVVRQALAGLAALPHRQREALLRIAVEGRSQDEVAEELGVSRGAVRQLVHRARTSLRTAATALTPLPLAGWLAAEGSDERADLATRVGELVAGAGGGVTIAKAGAVAVLAGGAVTGPGVVERIEGDAPRAAAMATPARAEGERVVRRFPPTDVVPPPAATPDAADARDERRGRADDGDRSGPQGGDGDDGHDRSGPGGEQDDRSGPGGEQDDRSGPSGEQDDRSGPSGEQDDRSAPADAQGDRSGPGDEPDRSGPGAGAEPEGSGSGGNPIESSEPSAVEALGDSSGPGPAGWTDSAGSSGPGSGGDDGAVDSSGSGSGG